MIIRPDGAARIAITQPDHAALAGRIMHAREWVARVAATRRHPPRGDRARQWLAEVDETLIVDPARGAILDFITAPAHVKQSVWPRAVARLAGTPYAAALVAHHAAYVYSRYRSDASWSAFFAEIEAAEDRYVRATRSTSDELGRDYLFLRMGDLVSLVYCARIEMQAHGARIVKISSAFARNKMRAGFDMERPSRDGVCHM